MPRKTETKKDLNPSRKRKSLKVREFESSERSKVAKLTKECANYDCGECLMLDNRRCAQDQANHIVCKYFQEAVLPQDDVLHADLLDLGVKKRCADCNKVFRASTNRTTRCPACQEKARKAQYRDSKSKKS